MTTFNIRKLKIQIASARRELKSCDPKSRDRIRMKLRVREVALGIAVQSRLDQRGAA